MIVKYSRTGNDTAMTPKREVKRVENVINYLIRNYSPYIPKTVSKLQAELKACTSGVTQQMRQWVNIISNLLVVEGKIYANREKLQMVEFLIGSAK